MMINRNVHINEAWHTSVLISKIYSKLMNSFNVFYSIYDQRESAPVCTLAYASHSFRLILSLCWIHKFIYEFDNNRNVYGSIRFYPNATNSYQHVNRKQKHGLFPQRRRKKTGRDRDRAKRYSLRCWLRWTSEQVIEPRKTSKNRENKKIRYPLGLSKERALAKMVKINSVYVSKELTAFECNASRNVEMVDFMLNFTQLFVYRVI